MDYYDLGSYSRAITTSSPDAKLWFDRGLVWIYGYHHEEAVRCFQRALKADPGCAMAHWGIAYAIGPNYNKAWDAFEEDEKVEALDMALNALARARECLEGASPIEAALVDALGKRYPSDPEITDFAPWNDAYADAMRSVHADYPADKDVACLFAEAIMNRTPWQLWDLPTGQPAEGADTVEAIEVLERAFAELEGAWDHAGLLHMYIHLMEMSPHPERALRHGDRLSSLIEDAGHLLHMATHIDVLCGDYENVVSRNHRASVADRKYLANAGTGEFYALYCCHNLHFKIYGAMFLGQPDPALETADELEALLTDEVIRPLADWLEPFFPMRQHVLIRFGRWQEIIEQSLPSDAALYSMTTALMRYARTVALANLGRSRCSWENSSITRANTTLPLNTFARRCASTTHSLTMNPGAGCSRRATPSVRSCWSRVAPSKQKRCTAPTSDSMPRSAGPANIQVTCGACMACMSAW
jgi:tetratricopeptide (TPR) repeat protein